MVTLETLKPPHNNGISELDAEYVKGLADPELPIHQRENYAKTIALANHVGRDLRDDGGMLSVEVILTENDITPIPNIYMIEGDGLDFKRHAEIKGIEFVLAHKALSGKVDSAHAVLPGDLTVQFAEEDPEPEKKVAIVCKGYFKRSFNDRLERVKSEILISRQQRERNEIAFQPIATVVTPQVSFGDKPGKVENDILLITKLDESVTSMDNSPWVLGFTQDNLIAAESAMSALARFNIGTGLHGDAKIKNVAQRQDGQTSMIDFETSKILDTTIAENAAEAVNVDFGHIVESLEKSGFMSLEPRRKGEVVQQLAQSYLDLWVSHSIEVQDAVFQEVSGVCEKYR